MRKFEKVLAGLNRGNVVNIPMAYLETPSENRCIDNDFVEELKGSSDKFGLMQNILVSVDMKNQKFIVRDGNHRVQAARALGFPVVPAKLLPKDKPNVALLANKMSTLAHSTMELAQLCKDAIGDGYAQKDLVELFRIQKSVVSELIKIAELPEDIQKDAKTDPKKFNHMTLLKLAKLSGNEQKAEFERIKKGNKKESVRFSTFMKQLDANKLTKKKLTSADIEVLRSIMDRIQHVIADSQFLAEPVVNAEHAVDNSPVEEVGQPTSLAAEDVVDDVESMTIAPDMASEAA